MYFIHEIHKASPAGAGDYEAFVRDHWSAAVDRQPDARLVWAARALPGSPFPGELITMTGVATGDSLEALGERIREGDLRSDAETMATMRLGLIRRIVAPLRFTTFEPGLESRPGSSGDAETRMYIHDFVPPRIGQQRRYEEAMTKVFLGSDDVAGIDYKFFGGFETVAGGGPVPENLMLSAIRTGVAGTQLLSHGNAREAVKPGTWMWDALQVRDTWTSRLVRTVPWSPTK